MEFTTDVITQVWEQLQEQARQQGIVLEDLPASEQMSYLYRGLQALGGALTARLWEAKDQALHRGGVVCQQEGCDQAGRPMRRPARRTVQVTTVFRKVKFRRGEYQGRCGHRRRPLDEALGLRPGQVGPYLEGLLAEVGAQVSFERGARWLARWFYVEVSPNTVRRATVAWGKRLAQEEQAQYQASVERSGPPAPGPKRVYGAIDGGFVPVRKGENGAEGWREAKLVAWFQEGRRYGQGKGSQEEAKPRAVAVKVAGTLGAKEAFGKVLWASGEAYGANGAAEVVIVGDGAAWIWDLVTTYYPQAVEILDWSHAVGRLHQVRRAVWGEDEPAGWAWAEGATAALWAGEVAGVLQACEALAQRGGAGAEEAAKAVRYFERHSQRIRYDRFREAGYFIGSGVIESQVKQVVTGRLKVAGAQWKIASGEAVLKARCAWLHDDSPLRLPLVT